MKQPTFLLFALSALRFALLPHAFKFCLGMFAGKILEQYTPARQEFLNPEGSFRTISARHQFGPEHDMHAGSCPDVSGVAVCAALPARVAASHH